MTSWNARGTRTLAAPPLVRAVAGLLVVGGLVVLFSATDAPHQAIGVAMLVAGAVAAAAVEVARVVRLRRVPAETAPAADVLR